MILEHSQLVFLLRKLDEVRAMAIEGSKFYCKTKYVGDRHGVHGRNHLAIDSESLDVVCMQCLKNSKE